MYSPEWTEVTSTVGYRHVHNTPQGRQRCSGDWWSLLRGHQQLAAGLCESLEPALSSCPQQYLLQQEPFEDIHSGLRELLEVEQRP